MRGLDIPGATVIGNIADSAGGGETPGTDFSDVDLAAEALDSRITYSRAGSLNFWGKKGLLQRAKADVWPLEYQSGVAAGRHEPEPQATNLLAYSSNFNAWTKSGITVTQNATESITGEKTASMLTATAVSYSRVFVTPRLTAGQNTLTLIVKPGKTHYLHGTFEDLTTTNTMRFYADLDSLECSVVVVRGTITGTVSAVKIVGGWVQIVLHANAPADSGYYVFFGPSNAAGAVAATVGDTIYAAFAQLEAGALNTSLIETNGAAATRAAAFAMVSNPGGLATAVREQLTDGKSVNVSFTAVDNAALSGAKSAWGARYIKRVEFLKS